MSSNSSPSFTEASQALDKIVERFRHDSLPLEDALALFQEGVAHIKTCQSTLIQARGEVEELVKSLQADGESLTRPFEA